MANKPRPGSVTIRFYAELNDFLPPEKRSKPLLHQLPSATSVKDLIEGLGVPHTMVDLILINGKPVAFSSMVCANDYISVYPVFETLDISPISPRLRPAPLREPRFACDVHLGKLARYLRLLGFDTFYSTSAADPDLVSLALREHRTILTRDTGLLKRKEVTHGYYVRNTDPRRQLTEVCARFHLQNTQQPFTRCLICNTTLQPIAKNDILDRLPEKVRQTRRVFLICPGCRRIYWKGTHYNRLQQLIEECSR